MNKLTLPGSIRSKKNSKQIIPMPAHKKTSNKHLWSKLGWQFCYMQIQPSNAYKKWEKLAQEYALIQWRAMGHLSPLTGPIKVKMLAYYKGSRPDLSGAMESVGDCLEGLAWVDDRQIEIWDGESRVIHDLKNPRTEIEIWQIAEVAEHKKKS